MIPNKILLIFSLFLAAKLTAVESYFDMNLCSMEKFPVGGGVDGAVYLSTYGPGKNLVIYKIIQNKSLKNIANEVHANCDLFGSSLITTSFSFYANGDGYVFAMEPLLGGSLRDLYHFLDNKNGTMNSDWVKLTIARVCLGIDFIHSKGWAWRDGHPGNIFIDHKTGLVKLGDFGESRRLSSNPQLRQKEEGEDWDKQRIRDGIFVIFAEYLSPSDKNQLPGVINLQGIKDLDLFQNFDWEAARCATESGFVPLENEAYREWYRILKNPIVSECSPLNTDSFAGFSLSKELSEAL